MCRAQVHKNSRPVEDTLSLDSQAAGNACQLLLDGLYCSKWKTCPLTCCPGGARSTAHSLASATGRGKRKDERKMWGSTAPRVQCVRRIAIRLCASSKNPR